MEPNDDSDGDDEQRDYERIRRRRNIAVALVLGGLVVLFFLMTMVRIGNFYGP
jgi:hypothetical protein